jgi:hypothetical protein
MLLTIHPSSADRQVNVIPATEAFLKAGHVFIGRTPKPETWKKTDERFQSRFSSRAVSDRRETLNRSVVGCTWLEGQITEETVLCQQ